MIVENKHKNLKDYTLPELEKFFSGIGEPAYRARQVAEWIFKKGVYDFAAMTNLPAALRERLACLAVPGHMDIREKQVSNRGDTAKYLFVTADGETVESVLMTHSYGRSACISTQVGCRMGCALCASTLGGMVRNLSAGEMYDQVLAMQQDSGCRISRIVLMGTGEPLDNYDQTVRFLTNINAVYGLNIGFRHITISTCGIEPRIRQLAGEGFPVTLAVSLHAPNDVLRDKLVPVNRKYPIGVLMDACRYYYSMTGRRITFEYALLAGVNDTPAHAGQLVRLTRGLPCHINLIPYNPVRERPFKKPSPAGVLRFMTLLEDGGAAVTQRRELGSDIDAACGQLRRKTLFSAEKKGHNT